MEHMAHEVVSLEAVTITGIAVRTDNSKVGLEKIQQHWGAFFQQGVMDKVPGKRDTAIYEAYFDYESDASGAYTLILGGRTEPSSEPPSAGLTTCTLPAAVYARFHVPDPQAIRGAWEHIWTRADLVRTYTGDFEIIRESGAEIYVAIRR
jgi:predicted transcriptional regulator YdeE